jgi:hypothetical protein
MSADRGKAETQATPRLVCLSYHVEGERAPVLLGRTDAVAWFEARIAEGVDGPALVAHNAPFDLRVMLRAVWEERGIDYTEEVFSWVWHGRVRDTAIREMLGDIAGGGLNPRGYALDRLVHHYFPDEGASFGGAAKKEPWAWRFRYAELADLPVAQWPPAAARYAEEDATWALKVFQAQDEPLNETWQTCAHWWLALAGARGLRVDYQWALDLDAFYVEQAEEAAARLRAAGVMDEEGTIKQAIKRNLFGIAWEEIGEPPRRTETGAIQTDAATLDYLTERDATGDPAFAALVAFNRATKFRATYLEPILSAGEWDEPLCPRYNPLVESGRTSAAKPNVQNFPARSKASEANARRKGSEIRGCFIPRHGYVYVQADYTALELVTLAQVLTNIFYADGGISSLAQAINGGMDPHLRLAAQLVPCDYDEAVRMYRAGDERIKSLRQLGKVANFGYPGGLGAASFGSFAKASYGLEVTEARAKWLRAAWFEAWPEMNYYFKWIESLKSRRAQGYVCEQHGPDRATSGWRTRTTPSFTAACNTAFQGLAADGFKYAGWLLSKECYIDEGSPLFGGAPVLGIHDEYVVEVRAENADQAKKRVEEIMIRGMRRFTPDVTVRVEGQILTERWMK